MQAQGQESIQTPRKTKNSDRTDGTVLNVSIWASKCFVRIVGNSPGRGRNSHVPFKFSFALHYKLACMWRNFKQFICSFCPKLLYINMQVRLHNLYCPKPWSLVRILICSGTSIEFFFSIYFFVTGVKKLYHPLYWGSLNPCPTVYQNSNLAPRLGEIKRDKLTIHGSIP